MAEKWAFTIKYNPNGLTSDELRVKYDEIISFWRKNKVNIIEMRSEDQDKKGRQTKLHIHGTCEISRGVYRKKLQIKDYHIKLVQWSDKGWTDYINKNCKVKMVCTKHDQKGTPNNDDENITPMDKKDSSIKITPDNVDENIFKSPIPRHSLFKRTNIDENI